jgi:hypothetical protein
MKYLDVQITPEDVDALSNVLAQFKQLEEYSTKDAELSDKWLSYVRDRLYNEWKELPDGSHLKEAYIDDVWSWNDEDLYN